MAELATLFATSFVAATLVPLPSEAALYAYVYMRPQETVLAVAVATIGNTAGGMTSYLLGRLVPKKVDAKAMQWARRYGSPITALTWLPLIGDALCVAAGWLRMNALAVLAFMTAGRLARYIVVASLA